MKKLLFLLLTLLLLANAKAQNQVSQKNTTAIFKIDPFGNDSIDCCVKWNQMIKFRISHVNTIKLEGRALTKNADIDFAPPAGALFPVKQPEAAAATSQDKTSQTTPELTKALASLKDNLLAERSNFMLVEKKVERNGKPNRQLQDSLLIEKRIIDSLTKELEALTEKEEKIAAAKEEFITQYLLLRTALQKIQRFLKVEAQLDSMLKENLIRDVDLLKENASIYMESVYGSRLPGACVSALNTTLDGIADNYVLLKKAYEEMNPSQTDSMDIAMEQKKENGVAAMTGHFTFERKLLFEKEFSYIEKLANQISEPEKNSDIFNKANAGILLYNRIREESFTAYTKPQQATGDSVIITPGLTDKTQKEVITFNPVILHTKGGIKVNVTTGYLLSFTGDEKYSAYTDAAGQKGVAKQVGNSVTNAIGALVHVYPRVCKGITGGGAAGFSLTAAGDVGFYLGASALFLEKNRLAITAGISEIKISRLDMANLGNEITSGSGKYPFLNTANTEPRYNSLYRGAFFVGITYNIFGGK